MVQDWLQQGHPLKVGIGTMVGSVVPLNKWVYRLWPLAKIVYMCDIPTYGEISMVFYSVAKIPNGKWVRTYNPTYNWTIPTYPTEWTGVLTDLRMLGSLPPSHLWLLLYPRTPSHPQPTGSASQLNHRCSSPSLPGGGAESTPGRMAVGHLWAGTAGGFSWGKKVGNN